MIDALERSLPFSLDAERSVLGAIVVSSDAFEIAASMISDLDFHRDAHRRIWIAMRELNASNMAIDFLTLKERLISRHDLGEVGGVAYLSGLADGMPRSANVKHYAEIVAEKARLRTLISVGMRMASQAYDAEPADEIAVAAEQGLLDAQRASAGRTQEVSACVKQLFAEIEYRYAHQGELLGVTTGFPSIDALTSGWQQGDLIVIAARPSVGKTIFAVTTAYHAAFAGARVAFFSLEMRAAQIHRRLLSNLSRVPISRIMSGFMGGTDFGRLGHAINQIGAVSIVIDDHARATVGQIRSTCRRMKSETRGLDLVVVDYVQLMGGSVARRGANRNEEIADITRRLKIMADELNVPVLLVSQLSRAGAKRPDARPRLEDLRDSGAIEQDADTVCFLHREDHKVSGTTEFLVEKARNGPTGTRYVTVDLDTVSVTDGGEPPPEPPQPELWAGRESDSE